MAILKLSKFYLGTFIQQNSQQYVEIWVVPFFKYLVYQDKIIA